MNSAENMDGLSWRIVRLAAFLFFAVASGLLISSLADAGSHRLGADTPAPSFGFLLTKASPQG